MEEFKNGKKWSFCWIEKVRNNLPLSASLLNDRKKFNERCALLKIFLDNAKDAHGKPEGHGGPD